MAKQLAKRFMEKIYGKKSPKIKIPRLWCKVVELLYGKWKIPTLRHKSRKFGPYGDGLAASKYSYFYASNSASFFCGI